MRNGLNFKCTKNITKNDLIKLCESLNQKLGGLNHFKPEAITEGGIYYKWNSDCPNEWYKSIRFKSAETWDWIDDNVMNKWLENNDIVFNEKYKFCTKLKSFRGAPRFTIEELKIWEECFNEIGIIKVSKYPSKKDLMTKDSVIW